MNDDKQADFSLSAFTGALLLLALYFGPQLLWAAVAAVF